jgi:hypothetical protein
MLLYGGTELDLGEATGRIYTVKPILILKLTLILKKVTGKSNIVIPHPKFISCDRCGNGLAGALSKTAQYN